MQEVNELKISKRWKYSDILVLFVVSRAIFLLIMLLSGKSISEVLSLFDAEHYRDIAANGYVKGHLTAFFPVVPLLIRYTTEVGLLLVNNICFLGSLFILKELTDNRWIMAGFALSPIGFFLCSSIQKAYLYSSHSRLSICS